MTQTILVTGGTGYIGSHTCVQLLERGFDVVIADDLSNSSELVTEVVARLGGRAPAFEQVDVTDEQAVAALFRRYPIEAVIHFAGLKAVGESTEQPLRYYRTNLESAMVLLQQMAAHDVYQFVFSSSATVYGTPEVLPIPETAATAPANPYGRTKLMIEDICRDVAAADDRWRISLLRYFNPVGAHPSGDLGEDPRGTPNNLVPFVMQVAVGRRPQLQVFGGDWDTPDGSGVRDYIHVLDLASGHLAALAQEEVGCRVFNLGTGSGASVLDVVKTTENVSGVSVPYEIVARRPGDVATSLADPTRANTELEWRADRSLDVMLTDAWRWQSKHPMGFAESE
ncbi:MAG: UDP-glucose 4-epimerase GalE [Acidimicrobiales bacterium]